MQLTSPSFLGRHCMIDDRHWSNDHELWTEPNDSNGTGTKKQHFSLFCYALFLLHFGCSTEAQLTWSTNLRKSHPTRVGKWRLIDRRKTAVSFTTELCVEEALLGSSLLISLCGGASLSAQPQLDTRHRFISPIDLISTPQRDDNFSAFWSRRPHQQIHCLVLCHAKWVHRLITTV